MELPREWSYEERKAHDEAQKWPLCVGVPVERIVGPEDDDVAEMCAHCGARRPEGST